VKQAVNPLLSNKMSESMESRLLASILGMVNLWLAACAIPERSRLILYEPAAGIGKAYSPEESVVTCVLGTAVPAQV
jgi:hypothetical protein